MDYNLCDYNTVKKILSAHGFNFSKALGQNFIIDDSICPAMAEMLGADEKTGVLEVGPGVGVLTKELSKRAKKVISVELDARLIPILSETLDGCLNTEVVNADIMKINLHELIEEKFSGMKVVVCANLPYYITTPIIMMLLESKVKFKSITVMVQKEVAKRLCASEGTKDFGAISLAVQYFCSANYLFDVPNTSFMPPPKVTSTVVRLDLLDKPRVSVKKEEMFFKTVKASFAQRRKTLLNALSNAGFSGFSKAEISEILKNIGIDEKRRGETLSIDEFARLADALTK